MSCSTPIESATLAVAVLLAMALVVRRTPPLDRETKGLMAKGTFWAVLAFAVTVWLPVRSSLYAVWPGAGVALAAAALASAWWPLATARRQRLLVAGALLLPFLLWPVYRSRNVRWVELADLTHETLRAVGAEAIPGGSLVVLQDDRSTRANLNNAFGTLYPDAAALAFGSRIELWVDSVAETGERPARPATAVFALRGGRMERVQ